MSKAPVIELTDNGKTLVAVYPSPTQGLIISRFLAVLGEAELAWAGEHNPEVVFLLFPHQDMPEGIKEAAEIMTTSNLLDELGYNKPEGGPKT